MGFLKGIVITVISIIIIAIIIIITKSSLPAAVPRSPDPHGAHLLVQPGHDDTDDDYDDDDIDDDIDDDYDDDGGDG